ncbi:conserved Plasmodium protein, unknown function [Plasmodium berghei]|uniref:Uncharacterized protein n=2 Tax=Plasmodium berghei TaxID=5821 RepID=A0A509B251_PLABA|nr:conserved Plasmodium protein, unknown function [Plasmodium berghei ANKA]CXJ29787.1 conserved Plasmodium protein, unknown function [Plasmodium berghei]SCM27095.1 conserved Plasmodium protein, unknown function [Plasmodium berghei]SCN28821.1 conserved Plasmodium protein, unknown function [Plasmodium berghei]SCO63125.1 conserved Plasmodium protein, unknown function [Plasmodium berghei]SCO64568.1 conserved Plasmodium protein, unknown function [Plasmodium berghei]|eukprot:XP_034424467.1 conserved Plasmodium protein, unknown function [Plasmodium berghei ANKA]
MEKEKGNFNFNGILNLSKKTKSTNFGSGCSFNREDSKLVYDNNRDSLKYQDDDQISNYTIYDYSKRFFTILNYIFCILGIICAWGAIDSLVIIISKGNLYVSLSCYILIILMSITTISLYIKFVDKDYKPYDFF